MPDYFRSGKAGNRTQLVRDAGVTAPLRSQPHPPLAGKRTRPFPRELLILAHLSVSAQRQAGSGTLDWTTTRVGIAQEGDEIISIDRALLAALTAAVAYLGFEVRRIVVEDDRDRREWKRAMNIWRNER